MYNSFQKNSKKTPGALYRTKLHDIDERVFSAGDRDTVGRTSSAVQTTSFRSRILTLPLIYISDSFLHLQEEIINREKKNTGKERLFGYIQYPSISLNGL